MLKHLITSKIKLINSYLIWGFFILIASPAGSAFAESPNIVNIGVSTKGKYLVMNARLIDGFTDKILEAIENEEPERAKKLSKKMYNEFLAMHDLYRNWITATLSILLVLEFLN